jgi:PAS domain S-box-containing protein
VYIPTKDKDYNVDGWIAVVADVTERRAAEERLRASEECFRATFYQAAVGIAQTSIDGQWLLLNDRLCEILGYSRDELRGKRFIDITHPDDREASLIAFRKLLAYEISSWSAEKRYIRKDGVTVWGRVFVSAVQDQQNAPLYFIAVLEDITQKIQAQEKLRESEERFRNMADAAPVMIWVSGPDKGCTFFNEIWLEFTGRTMEQELGQGWAESVHPDDFDRCIDTYAASFDARRRFRMEYRLRRADGEYRWILDDGVPRFTPAGIFAGYIGSCVDITEKRRADEERQKFVSLADRSLEFIGMCDLDCRPFYVNSAGMRLVGLDNLEAACQVKVQDYFFPEDQPFITNELFPQVLRQGHCEIEIRFRHFKTGEAIWMLYNVFYIKDAAGQPVGFGTVSRDITARKQIEEMLRQSEATTRALLESAAQAILAVDTAGSIVIANRVAGEMFGCGPNELLGKPLEVLLPDRLRTRHIRHRATFLSNPRPRPMGIGLELVGLRKDGSEFPIEVSLSSVCTAHGILAVSFVSDVTERKRTEQLREELQRERERSAEARGMERFRLSFDEAPVGMALIRADGVWLRVNRALCEMTGYSETELIARSHDITHPDDRADDLCLLSRLMSGELASDRLEKRCLHKQGHTIHVLLSVAAVERDEVGRPLHFVAHIQDLTDQKRVERELEASRAQMVTSARLSALGMMAGGVAHEINNPLAVIQASASNMLRMAESGSVQVPMLLKNCDRIRQTADRISRIVRSLRHIAREGSADEFRKTPVQEIVDETLELCAERFRAHNIRLAVPAVGPEAVISCREAQICQVLLNLLQNAFDELVDREGDRWVELDVTLHPPWVVFSVRDSGPGITSENRAHIMEPFFTTKPVGKGTGLGLSISRSIALEHGGSLELDPESPHTCFLLKLPLSDRVQEGHQHGT